MQSPSTVPPQKSRRAVLWWLLLIVLIGGLLRGALVMSSAFPLGDGGFFYQSVRTIQQDLLAPPPVSIPYNGADVPAMHPPLAFYLAAAVANIPGVSLFAVFRWLPLALGVLATVAFYRLGRDTLETDRQVLLATAIFALLPATYGGALGGRGLVGAAGMLLGLMAVLAVRRLLDEGNYGQVIAATFWLTLTVLTAPEWALFVVFSAVALLLPREPDFGRNLRLFVVMLVAGVAAVGWVYYIQQTHGMTPLNAVVVSELDASAIQERLGLLAGERFGFTQEPLTRVAGAFAVLGVFTGVALRRFDLVLWLLAILLLPVVGASQAAVPLALVAALCADYLLITGIGSFRRPRRLAADGVRVLDSGSNRPVIVGYVAVGLLLVALAANVWRAGSVRELHLQALPVAEQETMAWIADNLARQRNATVLIVTGHTEWRSDPITDWFPALTGMNSPATVRAARLLPGVSFDNQVSRYNVLQTCTRLSCIESNTPTEAINVYVYLAAGAGGTLRAELLDPRSSNPYSPIYPTINRANVEDRSVVFQRRN